MRSLAPLMLFLIVACISRNLRADAADAFVQAEMRSQNIPGISVAVVKEGKVIKAAGYGRASVELGAAARPETVFQLASMTKQFTASQLTADQRG